jgi:anti-sigma factor RsiW
MTTDVHTLSGAYALDALAPEEAEEFRRHLDSCQACRDEVRELQEAVARMGLAEATSPPEALKLRILAAADRTPQEPPVSPVTSVSSVSPVTSLSSAAERRPARVVRWLAAAAAAVVIAGGGAVALRGAVQDDAPLNHEVQQVFSADDAHTSTITTARGGELTVAVSASRKEMAVDTRDLPPLDENHVYQLWSVHGDTMVSAAILNDPEVGAAMGMPDEATQVALTVEPAGGSEQPTTAPIVEVDPYAVLRS